MQLFAFRIYLSARLRADRVLTLRHGPDAKFFSEGHQ